MKSVEINDPLDCQLLFGDEPLTPSNSESRECGQCHRNTWRKTAACMWCGYAKGEPIARYGAAALLATLIAGGVLAFTRM